MAKNIMFQGTGSSVGKSILTSALCRILKQDGYDVAPFKSQNMALNSYVTKDGKEMGRAQVVQAEAAMIEPTVEMNPILLKPTSDVGSQVIVNGKVYKNMVSEEYYREKPKLKKVIKQAYDKLDSKYGAIVLEGAGSPAEINLREHDIVNMGMAELVDSPVVLIGDIDKGGVFASIYGTIMLLAPEERDRIKGFIINKFRGDVNLLMPGIKMIEEKINKPCLGVIHYVELNIDDEDSVTERFNKKRSGKLNIAVIKLPYISNFTDFAPLENEKDANVIYATNKEQITDADLIIIPGSKNTLKDMKFLYDYGFDKIIYRKHKQGVPIIGICGGYQMLGTEIQDPNNIESNINSINGLGLLDTVTIIEEIKQTTQISGEFINDSKYCTSILGSEVTGYEIHMGTTKLSNGCEPLIKLSDGRLDGAISKNERVIGTYLHGIFENDAFRNGILEYLRNEKGIDGTDSIIDYKEFKENEYDKLADHVRKSVNMDAIKDIMGL